MSKEIGKCSRRGGPKSKIDSRAIWALSITSLQTLRRLLPRLTISTAYQWRKTFVGAHEIQYGRKVKQESTEIEEIAVAAKIVSQDLSSTITTTTTRTAITS
jgi:hypothetical protein